MALGKGLLLPLTLPLRDTEAQLLPELLALPASAPPPAELLALLLWQPLELTEAEAARPEALMLALELPPPPPPPAPLSAPPEALAAALMVTVEL